MAGRCKGVPLPQSDDSPKQADVPLVRTFLSNTTAVLKNAGRGRVETSNADLLNVSSEELEVMVSFSYHIPRIDFCSYFKGWIRHVELVFSPLSREALGSLVYHILKKSGPVPVGEIGKSLQEMTNNTHITEIIKAEFKGLKKLIEFCPEYFAVGTEHPFNPIVSILPDAQPPYFADFNFIVSSLLVTSLLFASNHAHFEQFCLNPPACCLWSRI